MTIWVGAQHPYDRGGADRHASPIGREAVQVQHACRCARSRTRKAYRLFKEGGMANAFCHARPEVVTSPGLASEPCVPPRRQYTRRT